MLRQSVGIAGLLLGLGLTGCDRSAPVAPEEPGAHRVAVDLRPLHQRASGGVPEGCLSVIDRVVLSVGGAVLDSRAVEPGEAEVAFEVEVDRGEVAFTAEVLSRIDTLLYAGSRQVRIVEDGFTILLPLQKRSPVLQVCPDTLRLVPGAENVLTVSNVGIRTLQWEIPPLPAQCDGRPCLRIEPAAGQLGPGASVALRVTPNTAVPQHFGVSVRTQVGETPAQVQTAPNEPPAFVSTPVTQGQVDVPYLYEVRAADPEGDPLTLQAAPVPGWLTFTDDGDGTGLLGGTPGPNDVGEHAVRIEASDGLSTVAQEFVIAVSLPGPPRAVDDAVVTNEEVPVEIDVLANDTAPDPEGLSIVAWTPPRAGQVTLTDTQRGFRYFPAADASGPDAFTYTVSDAFGQTDQARVQVLVNPCVDFDALTEADLDVGPGFFFTENAIPVFIRAFYTGSEFIFDTKQLNVEADFEGTFGQGQMLTVEGVNLDFVLRDAPAQYLRLEYLDRTIGGETVENFSVNGAEPYVATSLTDKAPTPDGVHLQVTRTQRRVGIQGTLTLRADPPAALTSLLIGGSYLALDNVCVGQVPR